MTTLESIHILCILPYEVRAIHINAKCMQPTTVFANNGLRQTLIELRATLTIFKITAERYLKMDETQQPDFAD